MTHSFPTRRSSDLLGAAPKLAPEPRLAPISLGLVIPGTNLGLLLGPVAVGSLVAAGGWEAAAIPVAAAGLPGAALALGFRHEPDPRTAEAINEPPSLAIDAALLAATFIQTNELWAKEVSARG